MRIKVKCPDCGNDSTFTLPDWIVADKLTWTCSKCVGQESTLIDLQDAIEKHTMRTPIGPENIID